MKLRLIVGTEGFLKRCLLVSLSFVSFHFEKNHQKNKFLKEAFRIFTAVEKVNMFQHCFFIKGRKSKLHLPGPESQKSVGTGYMVF